MKWTNQAWESIETIYEDILQMPFIQDLANGSLAKERFQFYMAQDSIYLEHFGRALAITGAKANDLNDTLTYIRFAEGAVVVEKALHESYFKDFGLKERGVIQPACHHYTHFLKSTATLEPVEVAMAATLPCFWIYKKVGDYIYQNQKSDSNPYQKWIDTYGGEDFAKSVNTAIDICDRVAENSTAAIRQQMKEAFITASHLEYHFWKAAYNMIVWR